MLPVVLLFGFTMIMNQITLSDSAAFGGLQAGDDPVLLQRSLYQVVPAPVIALAADGINHTLRGSVWRTGIPVGAPFGLLVTGPRPDLPCRVA